MGLVPRCYTLSSDHYNYYKRWVQKLTIGCIWIYKLELLQLEESFSSFSMIWPLKLHRILEHYVVVSMVKSIIINYTILTLKFIESKMDLSYKEVLFQILELEAREDTQFMEEPSLIKISQEHILVQDYCQWITVVETQMLLNSW